MIITALIDKNGIVKNTLATDNPDITIVKEFEDDVVMEITEQHLKSELVGKLHIGNGQFEDFVKTKLHMLTPLPLFISTSDIIIEFMQLDNDDLLVVDVQSYTVTFNGTQQTVESQDGIISVNIGTQPKFLNCRMNVQPVDNPRVAGFATEFQILNVATDPSTDRAV